MFNLNLIKKRRAQFDQWRQAPTTKVDRLRGAFIGMSAAFFIGLVAGYYLGFDDSWTWIIGSSLVGLLLGAIFPKIISTFFYPFSSFGSAP